MQKRKTFLKVRYTSSEIRVFSIDDLIEVVVTSIADGIPDGHRIRQ